VKRHFKTALLLVLLVLWCIAIYEPNTPEMDAVGLMLHRTFTPGETTQSEVEKLLESNNWPIIHRLSDQQCREEFGDSGLPDIICPGGGQVYSSVPVSVGACGWFGRRTVQANLGFNTVSVLVEIGTQMGPSLPIKAMQLAEPERLVVADSERSSGSNVTDCYTSHWKLSVIWSLAGKN